MVVNERIEIKIDTFIIAAILVCLVFNLCAGLFDSQRTSSIISVSYLIALFCIRTTFFRVKKSVRIQIPDILFVCYFIFAAFKNDTDFNLNQLGDIIILLLYICIRMTDALDYKFLYIIILCLTVALSFYGYLQCAGVLLVRNKEYLMTGPFYNPAPYGALICFFISIIITVVITIPEKAHKHVSLCVIGFSLPALALSASRAAWLASGAVLLFMFLLKSKNKLRQLPRSIGRLCVISLFAVFILSCLLLYHVRPESVKGRLFIWKVSSEMIKKTFVTGLGYNSFEANYMNYQGEYFKQGKGDETEKYLAGNVVSAYNEPIRIMIEYGLIGLSIYMLLACFVLFRTQQRETVSMAAKMVISAYILFGLFSYPNKIFSLQVLAVISFACLLNERKDKVTYQLRFGFLHRSIIGLPFAFISLGLLFNTIRFHYAYQEFQSLLETNRTNITAKLNELVPILSGDYLFLQNYCVLAKDIVEEKTLLEKLDKAISLSPSTTLYRMKGDCLYWHNRYEEAETFYWSAYYMLPSNQWARARIAMLYLKQGKRKEAEQLTASILKERIKSHGFDTFLLRQEMKEVLSTH